MSDFPRYSIDVRRKRRPPAELVIDGLTYRPTGRVGDKHDTYREDDPVRVHEYAPRPPTPRTAADDGAPQIIWVHDDGTPVDARDTAVTEDE